MSSQLPDTNGWRLIDRDEETGREIYFQVVDGKLIYGTNMPVEHIVAANTEARNTARSRGFGEYERVASLPEDVYYQNLAEAVKQGDGRHVKQWLNDSDNRAFRTNRAWV